MSYSYFFSILFFSVCVISMVLAISVIQNNREYKNWIFFAMIICVNIWSAGLAFANIAPDVDTCEIWRRFSAIGWGMIYSVILHFFLILTERRALLKKWWSYILLYLPAAITVFAFAIPSGLNPTSYQLIQTEFGWTNVANFNFWDWFFYAYYIGYLVIGLILVFRWGHKSSKNKIKNQAREIFLSFLITLIIASMTDVLGGNFLAKIPQIAPIVLLIPIMTLYRIIKKYGFIIEEPIGKKERNIGISIGVILYILFAFLQISISTGSNLALKTQLGSAFLGILTQLQMMVSIFLVLREEKPGYIAAVLLNVCSLLISFNFILRSGSTAPLPGMMSYLGVIFVVVLIAMYKKQNEETVGLQKLLNQVSNTFLTTNINNTDDKIVESMVLCGKYFKLDCVHLLFFSAKMQADHIYEWFDSETSKACYIPPQDKLMELVEGINLDKLEAEGSIFLVNQEISAEYGATKELLESVGLKSLVMRPLSTKNEMIGILCLGSTNRIIKWEKKQKQTTNLIAHLITDLWVKLENEREIAYQANYDLLTKLPNKYNFTQLLNDEISKAEQTCKFVGVIFIDVDDFKTVNDSVGHDSGDSILFQIANNLQDCIRPNDVLARFGGDEFLIMIPQMDTVDTIRNIAERLTDSFRKSYIVKAQEFHLSASTGIAVYPNDGTDSELLIKNADLSMYQSKEKGKNRYTFCTEEMKAETIRKIRIVEDLHRALERQEFRLVYQPQVCAESSNITGAEALIRWVHPEFGLISPGLFIPMVEQMGLIDSIGEWVLKTACLQCQEYHLKGYPDIRVAVNVSTIQLRNPMVVNRVSEILEETKLKPQYLELEITESAAVKESDSIIEVLGNLKKLGVSISIDDFGTEYSSIIRLCAMPVDCIKLDMQFIRGIGRSVKEDMIIRGIIHLAHDLGMKVIAEGVEEEHQLHYLKECNIDEIQGFYYYKPMQPEEFEQILLSKHLK